LVSGVIHLSGVGWNHLNSVDVVAEVVRVDEKISDNTRLYGPVFVATSPSGSNVEYDGTAWFSPKPYAVGERVSARYNIKTGVITTEKTRVFPASFGVALLLQGMFLFGLGFLLRRWVQS